MTTLIRSLCLSLLLAVAGQIAGCGGGGSGDSTAATSPGPAPVTPPVSTPPAIPPVTAVSLEGFDIVSDDQWDDTAVRKVLHTFAYGGQASDQQINTWADMPPGQAIVEMLTFEPHNSKLSPVGSGDYDRLDIKDGSLTGLAAFWASDDEDNGVYEPDRARYDMFGTFGQVELAWTKAATSRGLNPFRHKIGFWETNYHMATNMLFVPRRVMIRYYDTILSALEAGMPYEKVLAEAAKSAAIAIQYGHRNNVYVDGVCLCNEDFAREYHQLFFGVLGVADPQYHETVSIKNTAAALTDMVVERDLEFGGFVSEVTFGTEKHVPGPLEILNVSIGGTNAAERIDELARVSIDHPESLDNLPVKIISGLADDNLNDEKISKLRLAWTSMQEKNLLDYLRAYAISTLFHNSSRIKYRTSVDRQLLIANLVTLDNEEGYLDLYNPLFAYENEGVQAFFPTHNVFGGQTGGEASNSTIVFNNNFSRVTRDASRYMQASVSKYNRSWEKDWSRVIPQNSSGYVVRDVAEWLWQRFVADGLKNFGTLERAHLYALLGAGVDLGYLLDPENADRTLTADDIETDPVISATVNSLSQQFVLLDSTDSAERVRANQRIGQAINFIIGSPFLFVDEGG